MQRHFTATAFVIDLHGRTLLLWHKRLQRWMPPGGHSDPNETPEDTAQRECKEETGLEIDIIGDAQEDVFSGGEYEGRILKKPFAFLLEDIPACPTRGETEHQHMDFVYMARPVQEDQVLNLAEEEGADLKWFTRADIEKLTSSEIYTNVKNYILSVLPKAGRE